MQSFTHASALTAAAKIQPIEFQNQQAALIRSLAFLPVDGRPYPVSASMIFLDLPSIIDSLGCHPLQGKILTIETKADL